MIKQQELIRQVTGKNRLSNIMLCCKTVLDLIPQVLLIHMIGLYTNERLGEISTIIHKDVDKMEMVVGHIEVTDEVAEALMASKRAEAAHAERVRYNRAYYSLDCDDGIEYSACVHEPSPQELLDRKEMFYLLWNALNSLPEVQGRRVDAYLILGKTYRQIAREEGVDKCAVRRSVKSGITHMKKYLRKNF